MSSHSKQFTSHSYSDHQPDKIDKPPVLFVSVTFQLSHVS